MLNNVAIEKTVLSSILFNPDGIEIARKIIKHDDFYLPIHQKIFIAMVDLHNEDMPIDEIFLAKKIQNKSIENILIDILSCNPISNIEAYLKNIKKDSISRQVANLSVELKRLSSDDNLDPFTLLAKAEDSITRLAKDNSDNFLNEESLFDIVEKDTNYIGKNYIPVPEYSVSILAAGGGTGKTWSIIRMADSFIKEDKSKKVLIVATEDGKGKIKARANKLGINQKNIKISDIMPFDTLEKDYKTSRWKETEEFFKFKIEAKKYDVLILDPLISFYSGQENDNGDAKKFMVHWINFAKKYNKTIIFLHHTSKDGSGSRGAGAFTDASRLTITAKKITDDDGKPMKTSDLEFTIQKENDNIESVITDLSDKRTFRREVFPSLSNVVETVIFESNSSETFVDIDAMEFATS